MEETAAALLPRQGGAGGLPCRREPHEPIRRQRRARLHLLFAGTLPDPLPEFLIDPVAALAGLADTGASAEHRVRSYLDANCAHCHGATAIHSAWSANINMPLGNQGILGGIVLGHRPDDRHFVIAPNDPSRSELYRRVSENIIGKRMPPLGNDRVDEVFVRELREWIRELPVSGTTPPSPAP